MSGEAGGATARTTTTMAAAPTVTWAGRGYAHLALPTPFLGETEVLILDRAVCAADDWRPVEQELGRPALVRRWQSPRGDLVVLVVLGWYPLLVTVGVVGGGSGSRGRRALDRVVDAVRNASGRPIADRELPGCVEAARGRWLAAVTAQRTLEENRPFVEFRGCRVCSTWSALDAPHCRGCGHRFTSAEDVERDTRSRAAKDVVARCAAELTALGRGEGLFPGWPPAPQNAPPTPAAGPPALPGRVVA